VVSCFTHVTMSDPAHACSHARTLARVHRVPAPPTGVRSNGSTDPHLRPLAVREPCCSPLSKCPAARTVHTFPHLSTHHLFTPTPAGPSFVLQCTADGASKETRQQRGAMDRTCMSSSIHQVHTSSHPRPQVEPFVLQCAADGVSEEIRRSALLKRRTEWLATGLAEEDMEPELQVGCCCWVSCQLGG
jgi:hypothetical protein